MSWPFLRLLGSGQPPSSCLHGHWRKASGMGPATHFWRRSTGLNVVPKRSTSTLAATPSLVEVSPPESLRITERETPRPADHRMDRKPPRRRTLPLWLHARHGIRLPVLANLALGLHPELVCRGGIADLMPGTRPALLEGCAAAVWLSRECMDRCTTIIRRLLSETHQGGSSRRAPRSDCTSVAAWPSGH
jgi:hypothetical protein